MKYITVFLVLVLLVACSSGTLSERKFTELYVENLLKSYPGAEYKIVKDLTVKVSYRGEEFTHYLSNAFAAYKMQPDSVSQVVKRYVDSSHELYEKPIPLEAKNIVPIIKPIEYLEELRQLSREDGNGKDFPLVYEEYNSHLLVLYAENTEASIKYLNQDDFSKLAIPKDSVRVLAVRNLKEALPNIEIRGDNGSFMLTAGGSFEASLILLPTLWSNNNFKVKGDIVVAIPNRDMLIITGSDDKDGIRKIKDITDDSYKTGNYQVSPDLFKWDGSKFEKFN